MRFILFMSFCASMISSVSAYARILDSQPASPSSAEVHAESKKTQNSSENSRTFLNPFPPATQALKKHTLVFSTVLRALDVEDFSYGSFNHQLIQNIKPDAIKKTAFDFGFAYHYRPEPSFSIGFAFDRLQITKTDIDLRYSSTDPVPPAPQTLPVIASDLVSNSDPYGVAYYYSPASCGNRGYAYEFVTRAYFLPQMTYDPFVQITIGWTHNRAHLYRQDGSVSISSNDQTWTWSIGTGCKYFLQPDLALEFLGMIRDQQGWQYSDQITAPSQNSTYSFTVKSSRYYSADFKVSICRSW